MDRRTWWATVQGVAKSQTPSDSHLLFTGGFLFCVFALSCTRPKIFVDAPPQLPAASAHSQVYNSFLGSPAPWRWTFQSHSRNLGQFPVGRLGLSSLVPQLLGESDLVFGQWARFHQPFHRHLASVTPEEPGSFLLLPASLMTSSLLTGGIDPQRHFFLFLFFNLATSY